MIPAGEPLLARHLRADVRTVTFGEDGDLQLVGRRPGGEVVISDRTAGGDRPARIRLRPSFSQAHNLRNLLAAVAAARALGVTPSGELRVQFSALRGERRELPGGAVLIDDCYNANPMSMRAAIDDLADSAPGPPRGGARRHARARPRLAALSRRDRRLRRASAAWRCS